MKAAVRQSQSFRWPALCTMWFALVLAWAADAQVIQLPRPGERDFIVDRADLITPEDEQVIKQTADKLLTDTAAPILVVTIESMAQYLRPNRELPWETFSRVLFDEWGIGHATLGNPPNSGILLLVSRDDRKARIELGTGWTIERDADVQGIMQREIIPRFKQGDFSQGIRAGVAALDRMARRPAGAADASGAAGSPIGGAGSSGGAQGAQPGRFSFPSGSASGGGNAGRFGSLLGCGVIGLIVALAVVWLITRGMGGGLTRNSVHRSRGWYGGFYPGMWYGMGGPWAWGGTSGGNPGGWSGGGMSGGGGGGFSGGGFSGGSFGGGFSGGRGASGSW